MKFRQLSNELDRPEKIEKFFFLTVYLMFTLLINVPRSLKELEMSQDTMNAYRM